MSEYPLTYYLANIVRRAVLFATRTTKGIDPDKVVFSCFGGRSYGDNTRVISERLHERCPNAKIVWQFSRDNLARLSREVPDYVKSVEYRSLEAVREFATARVWVDNFAKGHYLRLAKGRQYYIQTWHGDRAIKKIGYDENKPSQRRLEEKCSRITTASTFGEKMYRTAFAYRGEYIKAGSPRNDLLVANDPAERARIRRGLDIPEEIGLLLYAPTYREKKEMIPKEVQMDLGRTLDCLEKKTGRTWKCLFRAHYLSAGIDLEAVKGRTVDVTGYPDMTELLLAADMVLTDYSSCALDFIVMDRPALFYIPDWDDYVATRGVYFDVRESPLMTADNQQALEALIEGLTPGAVSENCAAIRDYFGYYETGRATDAVCDYILERLGNLDRLPE